MMNFAALDLGSNTFILTIADFNENTNHWRILLDEVHYVRLGEELSDKGEISDRALERAQNVLAHFSDLIGEYRPSRVLAVATAAARIAKNKEKLIDLVTKFQFPMKILSGAEEAKLTFQGAHFFLKFPDKHWVLDVGGASTELVLGYGTKLIWSGSFGVGCVVLNQTFGRDVPSMQREIRSRLVKLIPPKFVGEVETAIGVAGTPFELVRIWKRGKVNVSQIEGLEVGWEVLEEVYKICLEKSPSELEDQFGVPRGRSDVLLAGAVIVKEFFEFIGVKRMVVSTAGIRYGVLLELAKS